MSSYLSKNEKGEYIQEIQDINLCKWLINDVCCNDKSECLGDYPYPRSICEDEFGCGCYEKEKNIDKKY